MTITYQEEFFSHIPKVEFEHLTQQHWEEVALNKDKIKLSPDYDKYLSLEESGNIRLFTVRDNGKLVGYFLVLLFQHLHYKENTFAQNDVVFVAKEYRKGFVGIRLLRFAESCLKEDGVSVIQINVKNHKDFGKVLERLGFIQSEKVYGKYIGE